MRRWEQRIYLGPELMGLRYYWTQKGAINSLTRNLESLEWYFGKGFTWEIKRRNRGNK